MAKLVEEYKVTIEKDEETGKILSEEWKTKKGSYHQHPEHGAPPISRWDVETGKLIYATWYKDGKLHREGDKPAKIKIDPRTDMLISEDYYIKGVKHHEHGPAHIKRDAATGQITIEEWMQNGKYHRRDNLPALIIRNPATGITGQEEYYVNGKLHRTTGPATIERNSKTGELWFEEYYIHGKQIDPPHTPDPD